MKMSCRTMTLERAMEILNPEHREHYDSIETVNEACRMGMQALEKQIPKKREIKITGTTGWNTRTFCPVCKNEVLEQKYCVHCGQALDWGVKK